MQKNPRAFVSDTRNVGGRQHVIETMLAHQAKLRNIVANTRSAKAASVRTSTTSLNAAASFSSAPATYHLSKKLSTQRARKQNRQMDEQEKADEHMLRRMENYPLPAQRKQNLNDHLAHPVKLFRDAASLTLYPHHSFGAATNTSASMAEQLGLPTSPRRLYHTSGHSATLTPYSQTGPISPRQHSPSRSGMPTGADSRHHRQPAIRPDFFIGGKPRTKMGATSAGYKRASLEIMEHTSGNRTWSRQAHPMDNDEIEPGDEYDEYHDAPSAGRKGRPSSAAPYGRGSVNRPRGSRPSSAYPSSSPLSPSSNPYKSYASQTAADYHSITQEYGSHQQAFDPYEKLKAKLFALIVEHRIYRERAILKLLSKAKSINQHLNQMKLERILTEIKIEFEIDPNARIEDENEDENEAEDGEEKEQDRSLSQRTAATAPFSSRTEKTVDSLRSKSSELATIQQRIEREKKEKKERNARKREKVATEKNATNRSRRSRSGSRSPSGSRSGSDSGTGTGRSRSNSASPNRSRTPSQSQSNTQESRRESQSRSQSQEEEF